MDEDKAIRVLVVEDHEIVQRVLQLILIELGCVIDIAGTGVKALEFFEKNEYDIALMDLSLPDMNGLDVSEKIRKYEGEKANIPIVVLSAYSDESYKEKAKLLGLNDYILKPITKEKFEYIFKTFLPGFKSKDDKTGFIKTSKQISKINVSSEIFNEIDTFNVENFKLYYTNKKAAKEIYEEIFVKNIYDFKTEKKIPIIIDAGSNIGLATFFFKTKYPFSKVICFEPDPNSFEILQKNIIFNKLTDVVIINAALSKKNGSIPFYGEIHGLETDARGNSIIKEWGNQRETCSEILVNSTQLSSYIEEEIDFLKMDIEGAEQEVLEELGEKLKFIKQIVIEIHETKNIDNKLKEICSLLEKYKFNLKVESLDIVETLPREISKWSKNVNPKFSIIKAKQN